MPSGIQVKSIRVWDGHNGYFAGKGTIIGPPYKNIYFNNKIVSFRSQPVTQTKYGVLIEGDKVFIDRFATAPVNLLPADTSGWQAQNYPSGVAIIDAIPTAISKGAFNFGGKSIGGVTQIKDGNGAFVQAGMTHWSEVLTFSPNSEAYMPPYAWGTMGRVEWTNAVDGWSTAGYLSFPNSFAGKHAYYRDWSGMAVDVHPVGFTDSEILALQGDIAVGYVRVSSGTTYPYYWNISTGVKGKLGNLPGTAIDTIAGNFALVKRNSDWVIWQIDNKATSKLINGTSTVTPFRFSGYGNLLYVTGKSKGANIWETPLLWTQKVTGTPVWP